MNDRVKKYLENEKIIVSLIISLAFVLSSMIFAGAIFNVKSAQRFVSVKGFSERQVKADLALWPIRFTAASNELGQIYSQIDSTQKSVLAFLKEQGFKEEEIIPDQPKVTDRQAQLYIDNTNAPTRYIAEAGFLVKSSNVDLVSKSLKDIAVLVGRGVSLSNQSNVEYLYSKLDEIKPEMIEEATKQARVAAEKFARDSGSRIGGIKNAYQGLFSIEPLHFYTQDLKVVRVVTDIDYLLVD